MDKYFTGLVTALGLGSLSLHASPVQNRRGPVPIQFQEQETNVVGDKEMYREDVLPEYPQEQEWEEDWYNQFVDSLDIVPDWLYKRIPEICDREKLLDYHARSLEDIAQEQFGAVCHTFLGITSDLIKVDLQIANCFYSPESMKYQQKINEVLQHFKDIEEYVTCKFQIFLGNLTNQDDRKTEEYAVYEELARIGRVYYYAGAIKKAQEYFLRNPYTIEEAIKITRWEELEPLRDWFVLYQDYFRAGKIEWYLGNKEKARELIRRSEQFQDFITVAKEDIKNGDYGIAIQSAQQKYRFPFHRELLFMLCDGEQECFDAINISPETKGIIGYNLLSTCGGF